MCIYQGFPKKSRIFGALAYKNGYSIKVYDTSKGY